MWRAKHVLREVLANLAMSVEPIRRHRVRAGRTTTHDLSEQATKVLDQFSFFMDSIGWEQIRGKTVIEIGPGDAIPLAPLFLGAGAAKYVAIDRFLGDVHGEFASTLYEVLASLAPSSIREGWQARRIDPSHGGLIGLLSDPDLVDLRRVSIESLGHNECEPGDFVISFNVLEHTLNVSSALRSMTLLLKPNGRMIHRVDYGPHDCWASYENPLTFLTIPEFVWRLMGNQRGYPNRVRHCEVVDTLRLLGLSVLDRVTAQAPSTSVAELRHHLHPRLRSFTDAQIAILNAEFVAGDGLGLRLGRSYCEIRKNA